jgi:hypothetical protein
MIFDLDGVITSTAKLHFDGWKVTFDKMMASLKESHLLPNDAPDEFSEKHYLDYVDGKPRYDGVRSFIDALGNGENWLGSKIADQVRTTRPGALTNRPSYNSSLRQFRRMRFRCLSPSHRKLSKR